MIRIQRPAQAPDVLRNRGAKLTAELCAAYDNGARDFDIVESVYSDATVKQALLAAQHGKCCFCESRVNHISWGDIEHFRPKKGYRQKATDPLSTPGYYWLGYEWTNLLFCCELCNQRHKRNLFPLRPRSPRAACHRDRIDNERPLFINPSAEDPTTIIGFREEYPFAIKNNRRAKATIAGLGLERPELAEQRFAYLKTIRTLFEARSLLLRDVRAAAASRRPVPQDKVDMVLKIDALFEEMQQDNAEYVLMARAALQGIDPYP